MPLVLQDDQQVVYTAAFTDKKGQPVTTFPAPPVWSASTPSVTVTAAADGFSATVVGATVGTSQVSVTATNADGTPAIGTDDVTVVAGDAVTAGLTAGTPTAQP